MQVINLYELKHFTPEIIAEYLSAAGAKNFILQLDKKHTESALNPKGIFWNYTIAAWAGELLHGCCAQFSCTAPEPGDSRSPFCFTGTVIAAELPRLTERLFKISKGWYGSRKEVLTFHALASYHFEQVYYNQQSTPVHRLIYVANHYLEQQL